MELNENKLYIDSPILFNKVFILKTSFSLLYLILWYGCVVDSIGHQKQTGWYIILMQLPSKFHIFNVVCVVNKLIKKFPIGHIIAKQQILIVIR